MKTKDLILIAGVALVTMTFALALRLPGPTALAGEKAVKKVVPSLMFDGVRLTLVTDKTVYKPGDVPKVTLYADWPDHSPSKLEVQVLMTASTMANPMSRRLIMSKKVPPKIWTVQLDRKEKKTFEVPIDAKLAKGSLLTFKIKVGDKSIDAASISLPWFQKPVLKVTAKPKTPGKLSGKKGK